MAQTLFLTSPTMKGPRVKAAQSLLRTNVFKQDYLQGAVDGEFGPETARACKRAKYWLGYVKQDGDFGEFLENYLNGKSKLTPPMLQRRKERLRKLKQKPLRLKALEAAKDDVGMKENPRGSNRSEISLWWKMIGPWCAMAVSHWYITAGSKAFIRSRDWAYVPWMVNAAIEGVRGLALTRKPEPGDVVCFDWDDDGIPDHTGIVTTEVNSSGKFKTIEGNTAIGNDSNGGEVIPRDRHVSDVARTRSGALAFIHVSR
jgi:hypothetical protein